MRHFRAELYQIWQRIFFNTYRNNTGGPWESLCVGMRNYGKTLCCSVHFNQFLKRKKKPVHSRVIEILTLLELLLDNLRYVILCFVSFTFVCARAFWRLTMSSQHWRLSEIPSAWWQVQISLQTYIKADTPHWVEFSSPRAGCLPCNACPC